MNKLFQTRLSKHFLMLIKYWKLVFNDHFLIALFFMFGALAYGYSQALNKITAPVWWARPLLLGVLVILVQFGRLATLVEKPDPIFLLPQTKKIDAYMRRAQNYSLLMAELITIAGVVICSPFMSVGAGFSVSAVIILVVTALIMKYIWMNWELIALYNRKWQYTSYQINAKWLDTAVVYAISLYLSPISGLIVSIILAVYTTYLAIQAQKNVLDWRTAVTKESTRMQRIFRFFNMFTDVPSVQGTIHRRRYLDWLITLLGNQKSTYGYLFSRGFVRGADISGLVSRLTIVGMLIVFFIPQGWLNIVVYLLFIYLVSVQLISLYSQFDNSVFVHIYPVTENDKKIAFKRISIRILTVVMLLLFVASVTTVPDWKMMALKFVLGLVEIAVLSTVYLNSRIQSKG